MQDGARQARSEIWTMMRCSNAACFFTNESKVGPSKAFIERGIVGDGRVDVHVRVGRIGATCLLNLLAVAHADDRSDQANRMNQVVAVTLEPGDPFRTVEEVVAIAVQDQHADVELLLH
jgi:hypothetical protein